MDLEFELLECKEYGSIGDYIEPSISDLLRQPKVVERIKELASNGSGYKKIAEIISKMLGRDVNSDNVRYIMRVSGIKIITDIDLLRRPDIVDLIRKEASKGNGHKKIAEIISKMLGRDIDHQSINFIMRERGIKVVTKNSILIDQIDLIMKLRSNGKSSKEISEIFSKKYNRKFTKTNIDTFFFKQKTKNETKKIPRKSN